MSTLIIFICIGFFIFLMVGFPLISAHYLVKIKRDMKCFVTQDQDCFREIQLEFSRANIPGSMADWSPSQQAFNQPGSAHRTPKEIWIPKLHLKTAMEIIEAHFEYHLTEFAVVIDRKKNLIKAKQ